LRVASIGMQIARRPSSYSFFATDASTSWGMGGFCDGMSFSVSWEELRAMRVQRHFYPTVS
jgi:hypothetical protein